VQTEEGIKVLILIDVNLKFSTTFVIVCGTDGYNASFTERILACYGANSVISRGGRHWAVF